MRRLIRRFNWFINQQKGLSLLEVAIGVVVLGLLILPITKTYRAEMIKENYNGTQGSLQTVLYGLNQYYLSGNGAYPCPTDLTLKEGDAGFGVSGSCVLADIKKCINTAAWHSHGGICKTSNDPNNAIIIGGVPFAELKLSSEQAIDPWGNKLIYAVTFKQTNLTTYTSNGGMIQIKTVDNPVKVANGTADGTPGSLTSLYDTFIFSTGETGVGGYTQQGDMISDCKSLPPSEGYEVENCNFDRIFFTEKDPNDNEAVAYSTSSGAQFFDDITTEQQTVTMETWFQHEDNPTYTDKNFVLTVATRVGIGTTQPEKTLHVVGDIRSDIITSTGVGGNIKSNSVCNNAGVCFDPQIITETLPKMNCTPDSTFPLSRGVTGIGNSSVKCSTVKNSSGATVGTGKLLQVDTSIIKVSSCPGGKIATGFQTNGELICP